METAAAVRTPTEPTARTSTTPTDIAALERCVGDKETFLEKYWGQAPLLRGPQKGESFDDLASLDDLDHMVSSLGLPSSRIRMVKDGKPLAVTSYTTAPGPSSRATEPVVNGPAVIERFTEGATIVLESLHRYWRPLTEFCRELELALGHRLQVNAYITPPGSQGFDVHRDKHDVFILQVSGSKHWQVHDREDEETLLVDAHIEPGSALYIPKGFPHAASAGAKASAHLTVGILTHDSIDIVREIAKLAQQEPVFQRRLPVGGTSDPDALRSLVELHVKELGTWLDNLDVTELTERVARRLMTTVQPIVTGQLRQLDMIVDIDRDTEVARRAGATCVLFLSDTGLKVLLADRELEMPMAARSVMKEIKGRERFRVRDLEEWLTPESCVVLVKRLVREGLLEVVVDG